MVFGIPVRTGPAGLSDLPPAEFGAVKDLWDSISHGYWDTVPHFIPALKFVKFIGISHSDQYLVGEMIYRLLVRNSTDEYICSFSTTATVPSLSADLVIVDYIKDVAILEKQPNFLMNIIHENDSSVDKDCYAAMKKFVAYLIERKKVTSTIAEVC